VLSLQTNAHRPQQQALVYSLKKKLVLLRYIANHPFKPQLNNEITCFAEKEIEVFFVCLPSVPDTFR